MRKLYFITLKALMLISFHALGQTINVPFPICAPDSAIQLSANAPGGSWGGAADSTGVVNGSAGAAGNPYLVTYAYLDTAGLMVTDSVSFNIGTFPTVAIDSVAPFCANGGIQQLAASPVGGIWGSPDGSTDQFGEFSPFFGVANSPYTAWYTYSDSLGCSGSDTVLITVLDVPQVTLSAPATVCPNDSAFQVMASPHGGIWITGVDSTGVFDPSAVNPGNYQVVYSYQDSAGCSNVASTNISVNPFALPGGFTPDSVCAGSGADTIQVIGLNGGIFYSGAAGFDGSFNADSLGIGQHVINYTTSCVNCCPFTDSITLHVLAPQGFQLSDTAFCADQDSVLLTANGSNLTWSGVASGLGYIHPDTLGVDTFQVFVSGLDANGCASSDSSEVVVLPRPAITITSNSPYCSGTGSDTLNVSPGNGVWSGAVDSAGVFLIPDSAGIFPINYLVSDSGFCVANVSDTLVVNASPNVQIDPVIGFCSTDQPYLMTASPSGGMWTGGTTASGIFDPGQAVISGAIGVQYTINDSLGCSGVDSADVIVVLAPEVTFGVNGPYCEGVGFVNIDVQPALGVWGGFAQADGTFDGNNEPGVYVISYTVDNGLCTVTAYDTLIVEDCTSIEEFQASGVSIYPNPTQDLLQVSWKTATRIRTVQIMDVLGKVVLEENVIGLHQRLTIPVQDLGYGEYFLFIDGQRAGRFSIAR